VYKRQDYDSLPTDLPVATTWRQSSNYAGGQADLHADLGINSLSAGGYAFYQAESDLFGVLINSPTLLSSCLLYTSLPRPRPFASNI